MPADPLHPPSGGTPPADRVLLPDGTTCFLAPLAHEIASRHWAEFPDERDRYGDAGFEWCVHDTQYVLQWAAADLAGGGVLGPQLAWLSRLLGSRKYPVDRLARTVELAADVVAERHPDAGSSLAETLRREAAALAAREPSE